MAIFPCGVIWDLRLIASFRTEQLVPESLDWLTGTSFMSDDWWVIKMVNDGGWSSKKTFSAQFLGECRTDESTTSQSSNLQGYLDHGIGVSSMAINPMPLFWILEKALLRHTWHSKNWKKSAKYHRTAAVALFMLFPDAVFAMGEMTRNWKEINQLALRWQHSSDLEFSIESFCVSHLPWELACWWRRLIGNYLKSCFPVVSKPANYTVLSVEKASGIIKQCLFVGSERTANEANILDKYNDEEMNWATTNDWN